MGTTELDCRGLACPAPVLQTKERIEQEHPNEIRVTVDNEAGKQNVSRFLSSQGFEVYVEEAGSLFHVRGVLRSGGPKSPVPEEPDKEAHHKKIMVLVATDRMGQGDDELGAKLMDSFIKTLKEMGEELWRLVLINSGVKLSISDSRVLDDLKDLEEAGVTILVCGTCLTHYDLLNEKKVGETTNMLDIVTAMQLSDSVITL